MKVFDSMKFKKLIALITLFSLGFGCNVRAEEHRNATVFDQIPPIASEVTMTPEAQANLPFSLDVSAIPLEKDKNNVVLSLQDALKLAIDKNFSIKIADTQKDQTKWLFYGSLSKYLPDVNYSYIQTNYSGEIAQAFAFSPLFFRTRSDLNAQWVGFSGFKRYFDAKYANYKYQATKKNYDLNFEEVILQVTTQYYQLLQDKLNIGIQRIAVKQTEEQLNINKTRFNAGVGTKFDVLRSEAELASAQERLIFVIRKFKLSQAQLANTLGVDVFTPLIPLDSTVDQRVLFKQKLDINQLNEIALLNNLNIDIANINVNASRSLRNSGYSVYSPTVAVQAGVGRYGKRLTDLHALNTVSLAINWEGLNSLGVAGFANIKNLNAKVRENKLTVENTIRNVEQNVLSSYYNVVAAQELIKASAKEVKASEESLRLAIVRLQAGVGLYIDVINAQLDETNARVKYLDSLIGYNVAQAQLLFDMGVISDKTVIDGYDACAPVRKSK